MVINTIKKKKGEEGGQGGVLPPTANGVQE